LARLGGEELAFRKTFLRFKAWDAQTSSLDLGFARSSCYVGLADKYRLLPSRHSKRGIEKSLIRTMFAPAVIS